MASRKLLKIKPAELRAAFRKDLAASWARARALHPKHNPYAFALYGVEGTPELKPEVLTEEGLTKVARRYLDEGAYDTLDEARKGLRYSVPDSPFFGELDDCFATVDSLMKPYEAKLDETAGYALLAKGAMDAFEDLDEQKMFGTGRKRDQLLLMIVTEAADKDWTSTSAKRLNSAAAFRRFEASTKVEGPFVSCYAMAISPDERSLYFAGCREIDPEEEETVSEIVACDINGLRLKRRWSFSFPHFGDSGKALACSHDGATVVVLRAQYSGESARALLMRFGKNSEAVLEQHHCAGEASAMALSHKGDRVAVAMFEETLHMLDARLQPLKVLQLESQPYSLRFLKSGELLVATASAIVRVDNDFEIKPTAYRRSSFDIVADDSEKLLVVARWFGLGESKRDKEEFGIEILSLPSLELRRTILIPEHQLVTPAISPNGRYVAFEAHEIGKYRRFVAVFETATGREIARRKSDFIKALRFLRDNRTVAIGCSCHTKSEAVTLWRVPGL